MPWTQRKERETYTVTHTHMQSVREGEGGKEYSSSNSGEMLIADSDAGDVSRCHPAPQCLPPGQWSSLFLNYSRYESSECTHTELTVCL